MGSGALPCQTRRTTGFGDTMDDTKAPEKTCGTCRDFEPCSAERAKAQGCDGLCFLDVKYGVSASPKEVKTGDVGCKDWLAVKVECQEDTRDYGNLEDLDGLLVTVVSEMRPLREKLASVKAANLADKDALALARDGFLTAALACEFAAGALRKVVKTLQELDSE